MIQFPIALNERGEEVGIKDAQVHGKYTCVYCHEPMKVRKDYSDNRADHFAHITDSPSCIGGEGVLHRDLKRCLFDRITQRDGITVVRNGKRIELSNYSKCEIEFRVEGLQPDIFIVLDGIEYFLEICISSPCSKNKIASGKRIIEIHTTDFDSRIELAAGDIVQGAAHYSLEFYNFPPEPRIRKKAIAQEFPMRSFMTHDGSDNEFGFHEGITWRDTSMGTRGRIIDSNDGDIEERINAPLNSEIHHEFKPEIGVALKAKAQVSWNINDAIPPLCHYILQADGSDRVVRVDLDRVVLRVEPKATLELGVSIADNQFSYEVGRRYAVDKGLIDKELLTDKERSLDMAAIEKWLGYQEIE